MSLKKKLKIVLFIMSLLVHSVGIARPRSRYVPFLLHVLQTVTKMSEHYFLTLDMKGK